MCKCIYVSKLDFICNPIKKFHVKVYNVVKKLRPHCHKNKAINKIVELKGLRENLWRKHKRIKSDEEGQLICCQIQKLVTKIDELSKDIKVCDFIENNTLKMKDNIKEFSKEKNNKVKVKRKDVYYR